MSGGRDEDGRVHEDFKHRLSLGGRNVFVEIKLVGFISFRGHLFNPSGFGGAEGGVTVVIDDEVNAFFREFFREVGQTIVIAVVRGRKDAVAIIDLQTTHETGNDCDNAASDRQSHGQSVPSPTMVFAASTDAGIVVDQSKEAGF